MTLDGLIYRGNNPEREGKMQGLELHEACSIGDRDSLEDYLSTGKYDPDMKDPEWKNRTPLHWACAKGNNTEERKTLL